MKNASYLTAGHGPELTAQIRKTRPGQAHFAATGPFAATCGDCAFLGYYKRIQNKSGDTIRTKRVGGCAEFYRLTNRHGPPAPGNADACKYFKRRERS
jgi:hypothetical protein